MTLRNPNKSFFEYSENILVLFFFIGLIIIGYILHQDYGISLDEESTRFHGLVSLNYICELLFPNKKFEFQINNFIPKLHEYEYREYGVFFEILLSIVSLSSGSAAAKIIASISFSIEDNLEGKSIILSFFLIFFFIICFL